MGGTQAHGMLGPEIVGESGDSWHDEDGRTNTVLLSHTQPLWMTSTMFTCTHDIYLTELYGTTAIKGAAIPNAQPRCDAPFSLVE
jgi:hypothetical protein